MIDGPREYAEWRVQANDMLEELGPLSLSEETRIKIAFMAGIVRGTCCTLAEMKEMGEKRVGMRIGEMGKS